METESVVARPAPLGGAGAGLKRSVGRVVGHPIVWVVGRRLLLAVPLLFIVSMLTFLLVSITPGDPAQQILGPDATPEAYQQLYAELGLNLPLYEQYWQWLSAALQGDLGTSLFTREPVTTVIEQRFPVTLSLIALSMLVIVVSGILLGITGAVRGGAIGRFIDSTSLVGYALPAFWVGAVLISIFAVKLNWFPAVGYVPFAQSPNEWAKSLTLPVLALSVHFIATMAKHTRESMMDVLGSEHIRMAWANGIPPRTIYYRLALKNTMMRVLTISGILVVGLLSSTIFVEQVFALPGLGSVLVNSATHGDLPVVLGVTVFFTLIVVLINLVVDLGYSLLDPRVRTS